MSDAPATWYRRFIDGATPAFRPLYRAFTLWSDADGLRMGAAMSFYGILSLAPLLVLLVAALGLWMDRSVVESNLVSQIGGVIGPRGADVVKQALQSAQKPSEGIVASLIAFVLLLVGATGVFAELQSAFERMWRSGTAEIPGQTWWHTASLRLRGVAYILAFGFLLLVSLAISTMLDMFGNWAGGVIAIKQLMFVLNEVISFAFCTALFVALMRMSSGPKPRLRHLALGAAIAASLFTGAKHIMATYLSTVAAVSAYGAAGSLVVILMWIYFSSALLLFGAGIARAVSDEVEAQDAKDRPKPVDTSLTQRMYPPSAVPQGG
ncbi:MAG: YihY/virulence factor BrkB family protein [Comamonadaceae bacterium]|nr:MAG: YihY/virulence factor BrkB family protein [Comamonadaceae bacterium]